MLSNDILRSVRYILKANNTDLARILALGNVDATPEQIAIWLRKEEEEGFQRCPDIVLSSFLNGLIYEKRGKDEAAPALTAERRINNNIVLKKLRIAFSLKTDDILAILTDQLFRVSMPEITAMMRADRFGQLKRVEFGRARRIIRTSANAAISLCVIFCAVWRPVNTRRSNSAVLFPAASCLTGKTHYYTN